MLLLYNMAPSKGTLELPHKLIYSKDSLAVKKVLKCTVWKKLWNQRRQPSGGKKFQFRCICASFTWNQPKVLLNYCYKIFCYLPIPSQLFPSHPLWFHNFFSHWPFWTGQHFILQPGCFWVEVTSFCNLSCSVYRAYMILANRSMSGMFLSCHRL